MIGFTDIELKFTSDDPAPDTSREAHRDPVDAPHYCKQDTERAGNGSHALCQNPLILLKSEAATPIWRSAGSLRDREYNATRSFPTGNLHCRVFG